jgi:hypothetical protein
MIGTALYFELTIDLQQEMPVGQCAWLFLVNVKKFKFKKGHNSVKIYVKSYRFWLPILLWSFKQFLSAVVEKPGLACKKLNHSVHLGLNLQWWGVSSLKPKTLTTDAPPSVEEYLTSMSK